MMIWIDREEKTHENMLLLCARDRCMMPFGFYIENNSLACSCELDILNALKTKIPKDIHNILYEWTVDPGVWEFWNYQSFRLGDMSKSQADRCLPCQIRKKYKRPNIGACYTSSISVCDCHNPTKAEVSDEDLIDLSDYLTD